MPTMNTSATNLWVKIDSLPANTTRTFYLFYGNASATSLSNLNTFLGPNSTTDSISGLTLSGTNVSNTQRGFRFYPKEDILIKSMGRLEPNGTTRYITLFDFNTQAVLQQMQVSGSASSYHYADLVTPVWLTANTHYVLTQFQGVGDQYCSQDAQAGTHITYIEMRSKNFCTQNTFPTGTLANKMYGYPDMLYYVKKTVTPAPTVTMNASNAEVIANPLADVYKCNNMSVAKIGNPTFSSGHSPFSFSWTPAASLVNPLTPSPLSDASVATTYTAYVTDNYGCKGTLSQELKISLPPANVASSGTGNCSNTLVQACDPISGNTWVNFSDNTGQIIASLQPNGNNLGRVTITMYNNSLSSLDMTANSNQTGIMWNYGNKTWLIAADSTPTTPVGVRFYYNSTELDALKNASACSVCTDEDILLVRSSFASAGMEDCDAANNGTATYYVYWNKNGTPANYVTPYLQNEISGVTVGGCGCGK